MKTFKMFLIVLVCMEINISCASQNNDRNDQSATGQDEVSVFYFHFERRCATCKAVESVSKEAISELYNDAVSFTAVNIDDEKGKETAEKIGVSGQSLLIIKGDVKIDLTAEAFMNATIKPEELKKILKQNIDPLLR